MKKIYYIVSMAVLALFTSCQDFNETNFPGYKDATNPTNLVSYKYVLASADYITIGNTIKKPIEDRITIQNNLLSDKQNELKNATNATDSAKIQAELVTLNIAVADSVAKLKLDPLYVKGVTLNTNKCFADSAQFVTYVPLILNSKYLYADEKSLIETKFNLSFDTTKIAIANKYTLANPADYTLMGTGTGSPGYKNYFSSNIDPNFYIPIWLKGNFHYAKSGDIKLIRYQFLANNVTSQIATVFIFDGANWVNYNVSGETTAKFKFKDKVWQFSNSEILIEKFAKDFGSFTPVIVKGTYTWTHGTYNGGCFVANAYKQGEVEIWMVSPVIDLKDRVNPTFSFDHSINYFAAGMVMSDLLGAYISTNYTTDPATATWQKLDIIYPTSTAPSWSSFVNSGKINISSYKNQKVNIAFKYVSMGTAMAWEVSNVNVLDE